MCSNIAVNTSWVLYIKLVPCLWKAIQNNKGKTDQEEKRIGVAVEDGVVVRTSRIKKEN